MGSLPSLPGRRVFSVGWLPLWVYKLYDTRMLAQSAKRMFEEVILNEAPSSETFSPPASSVLDPVSYSFWLAANLPLDDKTRQQLLESMRCFSRRVCSK